MTEQTPNAERDALAAELAAAGAKPEISLKMADELLALRDDVKNNQPTGKTYEIATLADMLTIPAQRVPAMLRDLKDWLAFQHTVRIINGAAGADVLQGPSVMLWRDDGHHNHTVRILTKDGAEGANTTDTATQE